MLTELSEVLTQCMRYLSRDWINLTGKVRWRPTSPEELCAVEERILSTMPCIVEKRMVPIGNNCELWSIKCDRNQGTTPLLLVHGMGGGVGLWCMNLEAFAKHRPVYAFDVLGFGRSSRPDFPSDAVLVEQQFVESIEAYRKEMGLNSFILLGHSLGAFLCAAYTIRYPERVKHLIMADAWGMQEKPPRQDKDVPALVRVISAMMSPFNPLSFIRGAGPLGPRLVRKYRPRLAALFYPKLKDMDVVHEYIYHLNAQYPSGETAFKYLMWHFGWAINPLINRLHLIPSSVPVSFIYGSRSWLDRNMGEIIEQRRGEGYTKYMTLSGAGHHVYADRWDLFNTVVNLIARSVDKKALPHIDEDLLRRMNDLPAGPDLKTSYENAPDFDLQPEDLENHKESNNTTS